MIIDGLNKEESEKAQREQQKSFRIFAKNVLAHLSKTQITEAEILKEFGDAIAVIFHKYAQNLLLDIGSLSTLNLHPSDVILGIVNAMKESSRGWHQAFHQEADLLSTNSDKITDQFSKIMNNNSSDIKH